MPHRTKMKRKKARAAEAVKRKAAERIHRKNKALKLAKSK
jgi:hypothetical protein